MSVLSSRPGPQRASRRASRSHLALILLAGSIALGAILLVGYLLWPTWAAMKSDDEPSHLPMSIGDTLFNVPAAAVRVKVQRHSGPQERVDLSFDYPSLAPPGAPVHVRADTVETNEEPFNRIFLSIAAHNDAMSPEIRLQTIYPRYLGAQTERQDGLAVRAFRDGTPYEHEELVVAEAASDAPRLVARCSRDSETPGTCISERRIGGADLTFRFPRKWLAHWRDVAGAMDQLVRKLHGPET